jgi:PAS domain S-box-containing protein
LSTHNAQVDLEAQQGLLDALFQSAPVGFALVDRELRYVRINDRLAEINGRSAAEHIGRTGQEMVPALAGRVEPLMRRILDTGEPVLDLPLTGEVPSTPGEVRHWRVSQYPVRDASGAIVGIGVMAIETTAQVRAETALRVSEERFRTLADNISQFAWMADASGWIFWYNRRWFEYTGTTLEEMQGWGWTSVHHPDHVERVVARITRAWESGEPWEDTFPLRGKDGQYRWFLSRAVPIRAADGRILRWFGTNTDITELRQAERTQQALAQASREFAEASLEPRATVQTICRHVAEALGDGAWAFLVAPDDQRRELAGLYHPDPAALARARMLFSTLTDPFQNRLVAPLRARGRIVGSLGVWRQPGGSAYTPQDQQLLEHLADHAGLAIDNARLLAETQAAVRLRDEVLGAVSHDLKGPLSTIKGTAQLVQRRAAMDEAPPERLIEAMQRIDGAVVRMTSWIEELLDVAQLEAGRALSLRLNLVDLVEMAAQTVADHQQSAADHQIVLERGLPRLEGCFDVPRLRRVLDNLLSNAVKYSPGGSPIIVRVDRAEDATGPWAILEVEDQGVGVPATEVEHIFERFHRARNVAERVRGTGIGLAGARRIVEQHGGRIELRSQEGRGSTFTVRLPLPPAHAPAASS